MKEPHKSIAWYLVLAAILSMGGFLIWVWPSALGFLSRVSVRVRPDAGGRFLGIILFSTVLNHLAIYWAIRGIHSLFDLRTVASPTDLWPPAILGILESSLYVVALVMAKPEFIGFWIALKTAGGWIAWSGSSKRDPGERNRARRRFYGFLVGNGLTLIAVLMTFGVLKLFALKP